MAVSRFVSDYVQLPMSVDETQIADDAIDRLAAKWAGWVPDDADLEVMTIEALAPMAADVARIAANMPSAALRAYGTKLLGIPYQSGTPAGTTVTFYLQDDAGYTIPAGGQLNIDGYAFAVYEDVVIGEGDVVSPSGQQVYAAGIPTAAANDLTGAIVAQLSLPSFVADVTVDAPTEGGTDPQTDEEYQSLISSELRLRAKTIVTTRDFEIEALAFSEEIGRALAVGNTARLVTVCLATAEGEVVSSPTKTALEAHYALYEQVNTTYTIIDPTYTTIDVEWAVKALPSPAIDPVALEASINALLTSRLSPGTWGAPTAGDPGSMSAWMFEDTVRYTELIAWIGNVVGVDYVVSLTINGGTSDVSMSGDVPLPRPGTITGSVS
jgi:hypothetical protein